MRETFEIIFPLLMESEGTYYTDDPDDPGGATKFGITYDRLKLWRKSNITKQDVKDLTIEEAKQIYIAHYWSYVRGDLLPAGLDYTVFDFAVNSGPARAARMLQSLVGAEPDGDIGPDTLKRIKVYIDSHGVSGIIKRYNTGRRNFLKGLKPFWKYGRGWLLRVDRVEKKSIQLTGE